MQSGTFLVCHVQVTTELPGQRTDAGHKRRGATLILVSPTADCKHLLEGENSMTVSSEHADGCALQLQSG